MSAAPSEAPPQSVHDEEAIVSEILDHQAVAIRGCIEAGLEPEHFRTASLGRIYRATRQVFAGGDSPDEPTTWAMLQRLGFAAPAELGVERVALAALTAKSSNPFGVGTRARRLIGMANERATLEGAYRLIESVREDEADRKAELYREGLQLATADFTVDAQPTSPAELHDDFWTYLDTEEAGDVFKLPWADLNECVLGGFRRQQTSVLGAFTGMGKSWALDQMIIGFHDQGYKCAIFATEMSRRERVARFVTMKTGIPTENLLLKRLNREEMTKAVKALEEIPYSYFEVSGWSEDRICEQIISGGYDFAAIDVVNLLPGYEEKVEHASRIVTRFMNLAQRANCHISLVSHLNRERDKHGVKPRPVLRDLRQTGMLEANAHQILFLHRDQDDKGNKLETGELFLAKVRNGMEGEVKVSHNQRHLTFQRRAFSPPEQTDPVGVFGAMA